MTSHDQFKNFKKQTLVEKETTSATISMLFLLFFQSTLLVDASAVGPSVAAAVDFRVPVAPAFDVGVSLAPAGILSKTQIA